MPMRGCVCGAVIYLNEIWGPNEYSLIPEEALDAAIHWLQNGGRSADEFIDVVGSRARMVVQCPSCARLHVETAVRSRVFDVFEKRSLRR